MSKDKSTGKKLADMMYGNPEGAAFGIYPKAGKRSEDKQDREAAKNFPVDLARGLTAGFLGMPADILNFPGAIYSAVTDKDSYKVPFGSEDILKSLPLGSDTPTGQFASGLGTLIGGSANIGPAIRGAKALPGALKTAARNVSAPRTLDPQAGVIKMKGGNFLTGSVEKALSPLTAKGIINNRQIPYGPEFDAAARQRIEDLRAAAREPGYKGGAERVAEHIERDLGNPARANQAALNKWIQSNLTNYVKKEMATPEDPVRRLAEEGITHLPDGTPMPRNMSDVWNRREAAGFPAAEGTSRQAQVWEALADNPVRFGTTGEMESIGKGEPWMEKVDPFTRVHSIGEMQSGNMTSDLGFDHILDVLRQDLAEGRIRPEQLNKVSMEQAVRRTYEYDQEMAKKMREAAIKQQEGFPVYKEYPEGYRWIELTTPEPKLGEGYRIIKDEPSPSNWSVVPHPDGDGYALRAQNGQYAFGNQSYAERKWSTPDQAAAEIPNYAEIQEPYPDEVYKILDSSGNIVSKAETEQKALNQLNRDEREKVLADALKYEGDTMGHCVGGYCPDVLQGRSRIYSLRDAKGEPHVTVEVQPPEMRGGQSAEEWLATPHRIVQIKGKQNRAPKEDYLPFVQDFVRSGQWSDVGDLQNTGLFKLNDEYMTEAEAAAKYKPMTQEALNFLETHPAFEQHRVADEAYSRFKGDPFAPEYREVERAAGAPVSPSVPYTYRELRALLSSPEDWTDRNGTIYQPISTAIEKLNQAKKELGIDLPPDDGMARGGPVHFSDNPDVMALELQAGGLVKGIKAAAKAAKESPKPVVQAPSVIIPGTVSNVKEAIRQSKGEYGAKRVQRAADEIKNLERLYKEQALRDAFGGDNAKALMTMNPADFEKYAAPLHPRFMDELSTRYTTSGESLSYPDYMEEYLPNVGAFNDVPFLEINKKRQGSTELPFISGHEGRHRSRVMSNKGEQSSLVRLLPRAELREPFPRRSQEEYIEALREELERSGRLVLPEVDESYRRPAIELPEPYADGGAVHMQAGGLAKAVKALKAARGAQDALPAAEREANLAKFLEPSRVPQRLYHGTTASEGGKGQEAIRRIKPSKEGALGSGVYLTPSSAHASGYSGIPNDEALALMASDPYAKRMADQFMADRASGTLREGQEGGNMLPVYTQLRNPLIIEGKGDPMVEALVKLGMDEESASKMVERAYEQKGYIGKQVQQRAQAAGYDGLMQFRDGDLSEVVSYNPNAVKSAIGNRGTYDISDPDLSKAEGGAVHMQVGGLAKAAKALKAAKVEKELALPPVLPRAPAKTKEEIRPYAQRMAQQMTGEFYRPNPKKSENVAGKSFSQFKMEKDLEHDIRPTREVVEPEVADIEKQLGMLKIGISGDTTIADKILHRAGPYELFDPSPQHGGPRYGLGGEGAWASNNPIAATVQKRVNELSEAYGAPPLGQYMAMGPQGSNFAQHFADANLQAIDTRAMTRSQIEQINRLIREGSEKSGPRPSFPGIEDKGSAYLHFAIDPELRKHFNDLMQKTSVTERLNLPDGRIILHAITEPELRDKEILNTGFSQMRLRSAFDPESLQISAHPTYSHVIPHEEGSTLTRTKYPVPGELEFSDVLDYAQQHYRPRDMTRVFQTSTPRQIVDPQHIDEMKMYEELMKEYTGKKKGGAVRKAEGGEITADDLILEERKL